MVTGLLRTDRLFFELVQVSLGLRKVLSESPTDNDWKHLFEMSKKQSLLGINYVGINNIDDQSQKPSESIYLKWMGMAAIISQRNNTLNKQCQELQAQFSHEGLKSCILKGQGVARSYSDSLVHYRQSGDIDIWIGASREKTIEAIMSIKPTKDFDNKHIHFACFKDTDVEVHWIPVDWFYSPFKNRILRSYFKTHSDIQCKLFVDDIVIPTDSFQLVHQILHVYGHYLYEGVGLRQIMDLYFAQRRIFESREQYEGCQEALILFKRLGIMRFVGATQWLLHALFEIPSEFMICDPHEKEGRKLLEAIMKGGNFGQYDVINRINNESFVHRFLRRWYHKFSLFRFDPLGTILMPVYRLKLELWMRKVRKRYGV